MKQQFITRPLIAASVMLMLTACGNDGQYVDGPLPDSGDAMISITVNSPSGGSIVMDGAYTRAIGDIIADEDNECTVNTLDIFVFTRQGAAADYTFDRKYSFSPEATLDGKLYNEVPGSAKCGFRVPTEWIEKDGTPVDTYIKMAIVANDHTAAENVSLTVSTSTIDDLRGALATAQATTGETPATPQSCGMFVGENTVVEGQVAKCTSFPMSAVAELSGKITGEGATINATLVRNVARIDIFNNTPNLVITGARLVNANNKSCLFAAADGGLNIPSTDLGKVTLGPVATYFNGETQIAYNDLKPEEPAEGEEAAAEPEPTAQELREANTRTAFYLYEQPCPDGEENALMLEIDYRLMYNEGVFQATTLQIPFKTDTRTVDVTRNHLYRVVLGNGQDVFTTLATASFEVTDWTTGQELDKLIDVTK